MIHFLSIYPLQKLANFPDLLIISNQQIWEPNCRCAVGLEKEGLVRNVIVWSADAVPAPFIRQTVGIVLTSEFISAVARAEFVKTEFVISTIRVSEAFRLSLSKLAELRIVTDHAIFTIQISLAVILHALAVVAEFADFAVAGVQTTIEIVICCCR